MQLSVRNVDGKVFRRFKVVAVKQGLTVGTAMSMALNQWAEHAGKKTKSLLDYQPKNWGKAHRKASIEIDKILYGG